MSKKVSKSGYEELLALRDFFAYNSFVRKKYLRLFTKLSKRTLAKDRGASYPFILDIHAHILDVYTCWFLAFEKGETCKRWGYRYETGEELQNLIGLSLTRVKKMEQEVDRHIDRVMRELRPVDLRDSFHYRLGTGKEKTVRTRNVGEMLWHLIEEELQHRGELNALLWQEDIGPPVTSWFAWKDSLRKKSK
jgi:uncharacterized damage-inducible protein DinB